MRTIVITNKKGGCGKTTTAVNLAAALAESGAPSGAVDRLLGPERSLLPAALVQSLSGALQGGMEHIFLAVAVIAFAGLLTSLLFPAIPIAPREERAGG